MLYFPTFLRIICFLIANMVLFHIARSCSTQLIHALDEWTSSLDKGCATDVIYFDFFKAFDRSVAIAC